MLRDIVSQMPSVDYGGDLGFRDVQFGWGNKKQLNEYLKLKKSDSYPLIWLLNPQKEVYKNQSTMIDRDCPLILATLETRKDLDSMQRFDFSFALVLVPIFDYIMQGFRAANTTRVLNNDEFEASKYTDYSDSDSGDKSGVIEDWDAIRVDCRVEFKNNCLNQIKWIQN